jgi:hypothetical protein
MVHYSVSSGGEQQHNCPPNNIGQAFNSLVVLVALGCSALRAEGVEQIVAFAAL